jgi:hypothetical protein
MYPLCGLLALFLLIGFFKWWIRTVLKVKDFYKKKKESKE